MIKGNENYNFKLTEKKWQDIWEKSKEFQFNLDSNKKKFYMLSMFPYPSGNLHIGHLRNYSMGDVIARFKRMQGYNVLHPMGADAFGLPAENAAIKNGINPREWTEENVNSFIVSMKKIGLSFDFSRFIVTCREDYYKHQQKIFLELYKKGLIYQKESFVNWDPVDCTVLANEQVVDGKGWRSGAVVEKKKLKQWYFKITNYADEFLKDIDDKLQGWTDKVKIMQKNWIGKSQGALVNWEIINNDLLSDKIIQVYTTRPDTLFGASFLALSFDHPIVLQLSKQNKDIEKFIEEAKKDSIDEETMDTKEKKGIDLGIRVKHPFDLTKELPVYAANFILMDYGVGAIFGCPAHDQRDSEFAKKYNLPITKVIECEDDKLPYLEYGTVINSNFLNNLSSEEAKKVAIKKLEDLKVGESKTVYKMRDWSFSRQRYWGCPIPIVYCDKCGIVLEKEENLPVKLPEHVVFDGKGNPLDKHPTWKHTKCPCCGGDAIRETDTMDTFVDSSWYMLRYINLLDDTPIDGPNCNKVLPIDLYIGGAEHATMHLLYFRFFTKALRDCGMINIDEPCKKLYNQGMVCHKAYRGKDTKNYCFPWNVISKDGKYFNKETNEELICEGVVKMSKSKLNVISNVDILDAYGSDSARMFLLSDSPGDKDFEWTDEGIESCWKYINRMYRLVKTYFIEIDTITNVSNYSNDLIKLCHKTIKEVTNNLENIEFNKAIAKIRELTNYIEKFKPSSKEDKESYNFSIATFIRLFTPFAPHFSNEMAEIIRIDNFTWPSFNEELTKDDNVNIAIQVNGKLRCNILVKNGLSKEEVENLSKEQEKVKKYLVGDIKKVIYVPNKLINFVVQ